jgi:hypothetical protein
MLKLTHPLVILKPKPYHIKNSQPRLCVIVAIYRVPLSNVSDFRSILHVVCNYYRLAMF